MIRDFKLFEKFELELIKKGKADYRKNLQIVEEMLKELHAFGIFPPSDPLAGIEVDIKIAMAVNHV